MSFKDYLKLDNERKIYFLYFVFPLGLMILLNGLFYLFFIPIPKGLQDLKEIWFFMLFGLIPMLILKSIGWDLIFYLSKKRQTEEFKAKLQKRYPEKAMKIVQSTLSVIVGLFFIWVDYLLFNYFNK